MKSKIVLISALALALALNACSADVDSSESLEHSESSALSAESSEGTESNVDESLSEEEATSEELSEDCSSEESLDSSAEEIRALGELLSPYAEIVESGKFTLITTESKIIGGVSLPYVTTTCFNGELVYVHEQESHGSSSEMLITPDGSYYFNDAEKSVHVMPPWQNHTKLLFVSEVNYEGTGQTVVAEIAYTYERYLDADGKRIDFLFDSNGELKKMLLYDEDGEYELIAISISSEITQGRFEIPDDYLIKEYRGYAEASADN